MYTFAKSVLRVYPATHPLHTHSHRGIIHKHNVSVRVLGDVSRLPPSLQAVMAEAVAMSASNTGLVFNVCFSYTSTDEIALGVRAAVAGVVDRQLSVSDIDADVVTSALYTRECGPPDILVRTSGVIRLSNFMLWQCVYSQLAFFEVLWPEFSCWHLFWAILLFQYGHDGRSVRRERYDDQVAATVRCGDGGTHRGAHIDCDCVGAWDSGCVDREDHAVSLMGNNDSSAAGVPATCESGTSCGRGSSTAISDKYSRRCGSECVGEEGGVRRRRPVASPSSECSCSSGECVEHGSNLGTAATTAASSSSPASVASDVGSGASGLVAAALEGYSSACRACYDVLTATSSSSSASAVARKDACDHGGRPGESSGGSDSGSSGSGGVGTSSTSSYSSGDEADEVDESGCALGGGGVDRVSAVGVGGGSEEELCDGDGGGGGLHDSAQQLGSRGGGSRRASSSSSSSSSRSGRVEEFLGLRLARYRAYLEVARRSYNDDGDVGVGVGA